MDFFNKNSIGEINHKLFDKFNGDSELIIDGNSSIVISCPHSATHYRNGVLKVSETETAYLAYAINQTLDIPYIYKITSQNEDANFDEKSTYRDLLFNYIKSNNIKLLLDFHELSPERDIAINLCINEYKNIVNINLVNIFLNEFHSANIGEITVDTPFSASGRHNISRLTHIMTGIDAMQIEFNYKILSNPDSLNKVYNVLEDTIIKAKGIYGDEKK